MNPDSKQNPNISFANTEVAFRSKGDKELKNSLWLFKLMRSPALVKILSKLTLLAIKLKVPITPAVKATIYKQFCSGETIDESQKVVKRLGKSGVSSILDYSVEGKENESDFDTTKAEVLKIITIAKGNPAIPYTSLKLTGVASIRLLEKLNSNLQLDRYEVVEWTKSKSRINDICYNAFVSNVPIYIDAEESWIQDAIDSIAEEMMLRYNKEKAIVLTTLQLYRWDRIEYLNQMIKRAKDEKFFIGVKLVRGAYMEKENKRAAEKGYPSPIQSDKVSTDRDFDKAVDICLENINLIKLCAGTHNEASTLHLINKMKELAISNNHPNVYFSQLYGMSDHITFNLADLGYNVTKYLPYGPVKSTLPYLIRRAEENTAIAGQMTRELKLILEEKKRRKTAKLLPAGKE